MKTKRMLLIILATLMLMSFMLVGCRDRNNNSNTEPQLPDAPFAPPIQDAPPRPGTEPFDPDAPPPPMPERNPDGTLG